MDKNWTSHGYWIGPGPEPADGAPPLRARCGGPGICPECAQEAGGRSGVQVSLTGYGPPAPFITAPVHYVSHGTPPRPDGSQAYPSRCRAAIVTEVDGTDTVGLCVLNPGGVFFRQLSEGGAAADHLPPADKIVPGERAEHHPGTWHWPGSSCR